jgi:two-component system cell cycle response regulator DivK
MERTALIIDDNTLNLETLAVLLKKEGVHSITLSSPREISDTLDQLHSVDVVFLDIEFPNHDGFEIMPHLAAHPRLTGVPIVAYSVHISELQEARDVGFHSFIGKPLVVERFPEQLRKILNGEPVWEAGQ